MAAEQRRAPLENAEVVARNVARLIKEACPPGWAFALILASYGESGFMTYLSSMRREDTIKLLRETADKIEKDGPQA